jgi:hypothetical protein
VVLDVVGSGLGHYLDYYTKQPAHLECTCRE